MSATRLTLLVACALLTPPALAQELPEGFEPRIPPGYVPDKTGDEKGLWLEVEEYEKAVRESGLLVDDPAINNYVDAIVCRVAGDYCGDFRVYVIRNPGFNASMAPNGMMQVWTGLLLRAASADEVAAVVGHEVAHYTRLHSLERMRRVRKNMAAGSFFDIGVALVRAWVCRSASSRRRSTHCPSRAGRSRRPTCSASRCSQRRPTIRTRHIACGRT